MVLRSEITARELNQHSGRILDRVQAGEEITVVRDGQPVAILRRPGPLDTPQYAFRTDPMGPIEIPALDGPDLSDDDITATLRGMGGMGGDLDE